jgi:hypothetical protein
MTAQEIIAELSKLDRKDLERVYAQLHEVLGAVSADGKSEEAEEARDARLAQAAEALLPDYNADAELTSFAALDTEPFHAQG